MVGRSRWASLPGCCQQLVDKSFGHADPRISAAIAAQARTLEHVMLAGFSHEPAVRLAEALLRLAPRQDGREPLSKVFYADNGSAGVEVALKMAFHYFRNRGEEQRTIYRVT